MEIGNMLKENRTAYQLTQEQLAEKIFVSKKTISNWETGRTTPDLDSLIRLANLFDLSLDNLLLEGSSVVENIKKQGEFKRIKKYHRATFITNIVFLFIILTQTTFGSLSTPVIFAILIGIMSNVIAMAYFSIERTKLNDDTDMNQRKTIISIILVTLIGVIALLSIPFFWMK